MYCHASLCARTSGILPLIAILWFWKLQVTGLQTWTNCLIKMCLPIAFEPPASSKRAEFHFLYVKSQTLVYSSCSTTVKQFSPGLFLPPSPSNLGWDMLVDSSWKTGGMHQSFMVSHLKGSWEMETRGSVAIAWVEGNQTPSRDVHKDSCKALRSSGTHWESQSLGLTALRDALHVVSVFSGSCNSCLCPIN